MYICIVWLWLSRLVFDNSQLQYGILRNEAIWNSGNKFSENWNNI